MICAASCDVRRGFFAVCGSVDLPTRSVCAFLPRTKFASSLVDRRAYFHSSIFRSALEGLELGRLLRRIPRRLRRWCPSAVEASHPWPLSSRTSPCGCSMEPTTLSFPWSSPMHLCRYVGKVQQWSCGRWACLHEGYHVLLSTSVCRDKGFAVMFLYGTLTWN